MYYPINMRSMKMPCALPTRAYGFATERRSVIWMRRNLSRFRNSLGRILLLRLTNVRLLRTIMNTTKKRTGGRTLGQSARSKRERAAISSYLALYKAACSRIYAGKVPKQSAPCLLTVLRLEGRLGVLSEAGKRIHFASLIGSFLICRKIGIGIFWG